MRNNIIILVLFVLIVLVSGCLTEQEEGSNEKIRESGGIKFISYSDSQNGCIENTNNHTTIVKKIYYEPYQGERTVWIKEFKPFEKKCYDNLGNCFYISNIYGAEIDFVTI